MRSLINMLKKDDNAFSMGRVSAIWAVIQWSIVTLYLALLHIEWKHYDTLTYATIGYVVVVLCDKTFQSSAFSVRRDNIVTGNTNK